MELLFNRCKFINYTFQMGGFYSIVLAARRTVVQGKWFYHQFYACDLMYRRHIFHSAEFTQNKSIYQSPRSRNRPCCLHLVPDWNSGAVWKVLSLTEYQTNCSLFNAVFFMTCRSIGAILDQYSSSMGIPLEEGRQRKKTPTVGTGSGWLSRIDTFFRSRSLLLGTCLMNGHCYRYSSCSGL